MAALFIAQHLQMGLLLHIRMRKERLLFLKASKRRKQNVVEKEKERHIK